MIKLFHIPDHEINTAQLGNMLHGPVVEAFENKFNEYVGGCTSIGFNSATNAITAIFSLMGGPIVYIPAMIPPVVANALFHAGSLTSLKDDVDWVGGPYVLHECSHKVIIDSAQHVGRDQFKEQRALLDKEGKSAKSLTIIYSFYPTKPVGSCDGGMVVTDDEEFAADLPIISNNGARKAGSSWASTWVCPGYKSYMNSLQAEMASKNLDGLPEKMKKLAEIRHIYNMELGYANTSSHLYRIEVRNNKQFVAQMGEIGITCGIHYLPLSAIPAYNFIGHPPLPATEALRSNTVSIPFHEKLTDDDIATIIRNINLLTIADNKS